MTVSAKDPQKTKTSYSNTWKEHHDHVPDRCTSLIFATREITLVASSWTPAAARPRGIQSVVGLGNGRAPVPLAPACGLRVVRACMAGSAAKGRRPQVRNSGCWAGRKRTRPPPGPGRHRASRPCGPRRRRLAQLHPRGQRERPCLV